jgi:transcription antitermination factor NusG
MLDEAHAMLCGQWPVAADPVFSEARSWWLVHTKPRCEKALAGDLDKRGIAFFLPLAKVRRKYRSRTEDVRIPLFPSYMFVCGGEEERYATLTTHRAVNVIEVFDQRKLTNELRNVYLAVTSDKPVDLYAGLKQGQRCRVVRGSLQGLEGVVLRRRSLCRIYVGVEMLGQSAQVEIDPALLEMIG